MQTPGDLRFVTNAKQISPKYVISDVGFSVLPLIQALCDGLIQEGIDYCHWKSNQAIDRSASGENDLDLLVSRADEQDFTEILSRLGFKQALEYSKYRIPGILDYYGHDQKTGRFVHVHAHYQL